MKVYGGPNVADRVLRGQLRPLLQSLQRSHEVTKWFYVRFVDPDFHLRVRLLPSGSTPASHVAGRVYACLEGLFRDHILDRFEIAQYRPEVDRYGGPNGIGSAETIFWSDSDRSMLMLDAVGEHGADARVLALGVDRLMDAFGIDVSSRAALLEAVVRSERATFGGSAWDLSRVSREVRERIADTTELLADRSSALAVAAEPLAALTRASNDMKIASLDRPWQEIVPSLAHMHANRLLPRPDREVEHVAYSLLARIYRSRVARAASSRRGRATG